MVWMVEAFVDELGKYEPHPNDLRYGQVGAAIVSGVSRPHCESTHTTAAANGVSNAGNRPTCTIPGRFRLPLVIKIASVTEEN